MHPVDPPSPDYVPGPEHLLSPDYVPGPEFLSPNGDDEPFDDDDDDDTDDEDEEASKDEDDDNEEEEHLALADSLAIPVVDPIPLAGDTKAFETDESAPTPRSLQITVPPSQTRLHRERKTVKPQTPIPFPSMAEVDILLALPTPPPSPLTPYSSPLPQIPSPPLPVSSPLLPLPSPLTTSPTDAKAPLGYREAVIQMRAASLPLLLPSTSHMTDILEAEMPLWKRACFTTPAPRFEVRESLVAGAARQPRPTLEADLRQDTNEFYARFEDAQDDRAFLRARVNTLFRDRQFHRHTSMLLNREATYARRTWTGSEDRSAAIKAHVRTLEAHVATLMAQTSLLL
ncbi:hypothetical protein Tco_1431578 [Tanacetum coccineum]